jgi:hypothetical protein
MDASEMRIASDILHPIGQNFQRCVASFLEKRFGRVVNKWKGLPDIQVEVNGVKLNLEVTTGKGIWYKVLEYAERGVALHAVIVVSLPESLPEQLKLLGKRKVDILLFNEELPSKLEKIAERMKWLRRS